MEKRRELRKRKKIVIKVGSSTITHEKTGQINIEKIEKMARRIADLKGMGKGCHLSFFRSYCCRSTSSWQWRKTKDFVAKAGLFSCWSGKADDDLPKDFFRVQYYDSTGLDDQVDYD